MTDYVCVYNCGSSSIKFALWDMASDRCEYTLLAQRLGTDEASLRLPDKTEIPLDDGEYQTAMHAIDTQLRSQSFDLQQICGVGHRVVHGGEAFDTATLIDNTVIQAIKESSSLAPLHNPANLVGIEIAQSLFPDVPHVAVFDTAFHQTMPSHAYLYALPYSLYKEHKIRRYGFHGTSHQYVAEQAAARLGKSISECHFISAHLGNGCSITAIKNGQSVDTSMGLTPLEGLVMGTRSGDVDPGVVLHLQEQLGMSVSEVNRCLNKQSGVLGISELSMDMRTIEDAMDSNEKAKQALEVFAYRLSKYIGAMMVASEGCDALILTGGIGENSPIIRALVAQRISVLGFTLDESRNENHGRDHNGLISTDASIPMYVIQTNEEWMIARDVMRVRTIDE